MGTSGFAFGQKTQHRRTLYHNADDDDLEFEGPDQKADYGEPHWGEGSRFCVGNNADASQRGRSEGDDEQEEAEPGKQAAAAPTAPKKKQSRILAKLSNVKIPKNLPFFSKNIKVFLTIQ